MNAAQQIDQAHSNTPEPSPGRSVPVQFSVPPEIRKSVEAAIVDPLAGAEWDSLLTRFPEASAFHTSAWARVLCRSYGHKPFYLRFDRAPETIALLPLMEVRSPITGRRGVSLPFSDFCGPLLSDLSISELMNQKISELRVNRKWKHVELRGGTDFLGRSAHPAGTFRAHNLSLLPVIDELWDQLASPVRRAIRKAGQSGVSVECATNRDAITDFYQLHSHTRRRHGLPPQPMRFFMNIYDEIIAPGRGFILLARTGRQPVAAAIFFGFNGLAIYKFGASAASQQHMRANNILIWEAIKLLSQRGYRELHFGRTELKNDGLRQFKLGWGAREKVLHYFRLGGTAAAAEDSEQHTPFYHGLFRHLPLPVNKVAGTLIYPHLD